jgi:hypothetical protein
MPRNYQGDNLQSHTYANGVVVTRLNQMIPGRLTDEYMIRFIGEGGEVLVARGDCLETTPANLIKRPLTSSDIHLYRSAEHRLNWLECVRTRKQPICLGRDRLPDGDHLRPERHRGPVETASQMGPGDRANHRGRRSLQLPRPVPARPLHHLNLPNMKYLLLPALLGLAMAAVAAGTANPDTLDQLIPKLSAPLNNDSIKNEEALAKLVADSAGPEPKGNARRWPRRCARKPPIRISPFMCAA